VSKTSIEWTEQTWNPVVGCSIVSPGCTNCYAMKMAARIEAMGNQPRYAGTTKNVNGNAVWTGKLAMVPDSAFLAPLRRKKPTTYFVNSMGDLFHEDCPDEWIDRVFAVMALAPQHTFQVLTKRAERMRQWFDGDRADRVGLAMLAIVDRIPHGHRRLPWPLSNVWLGVSTERQQEADERIPLLLQTPAAVRFISAEPLLGPIDLTMIHGRHWALTQHMNALSGTANPSLEGVAPKANLDWVIVGGESGAGARPMHPDWARGLRDQCAAASVPFFFKQWGEWEWFYDREKNDPDWRNLPDVDNQMGRGATRWHNLAGGIGFHGDRLVAMRNVGKKLAGRSLDGAEYSGLPVSA
jgi:protein gp37